jgi:hypothetical protein
MPQFLIRGNLMGVDHKNYEGLVGTVIKYIASHRKQKGGGDL